MSLVFFDFDRTLTKRDTLLSLGLVLARIKPNRLRKTASILFIFALLKSRAITNDQFKRCFCRVLLDGKSERELEKVCQRFVDEYVQHIINNSVLEILQKHKQLGDDVYLVSSNFSFVLRLLQKKWEISGVFATEAEIEAGRFTGRLTGRACDAQEKLRRGLVLHWARRAFRDRLFIPGFGLLIRHFPFFCAAVFKRARVLALGRQPVRTIKL